MHNTLFLLLLPAFCECLVLIGIHSYLGIHVIKRKVIFVDLALAQIAALGSLVAFLFGIPLHTTWSYCFSLAFTSVAAAIFALCRLRASTIPQEAVIGLTYAIAAAVTILLIDKAPHGAEHIKEIMTGSILWVKWRTIGVAALVYALVGGLHYWWRDKFILISEDPEQAWEAGLNVRFWDFIFYLLFGVVITLSVDTAGVLIVFVFLVAPAIIAMLMTDALFWQLIVGWSLGVLVTTIGLLLSYLADLPTGPAIIGSYGVTLIIVVSVLYNLKAVHKAQARRNTLLLGLVTIAMVVLLGLAGKILGRLAREHPGMNLSSKESPQRPPQVPHRPEPSPHDPVRADVPWAHITTSAQLHALYAQRNELTARYNLLTQALRLDKPGSISLALQFLQQKPPLFFAHNIASLLNPKLPPKKRLNLAKPLQAPQNQTRLQTLLRQYGHVSPPRKRP